GKLFAHTLARGIHELAVDQAVGAGEVKELERAAGAGGRPERRILLGVDAVRPNRPKLARLHLTDQLRADRVQRTAHRRDRPTLSQPAEHERSDTPWIAR